jgi:zinc transport system substrate-binding protein
MMMCKKIFCLLAAAIMLLTGCSYEKNESESGETLSIVTTCFPPYDFARAVTGGNADITMLLCPGAEAHSYEPTPMDIAEIQQCDVFIYIGGEGEVWVDKILNSIDNPDIKVVKLFDYVDPLCEEEVQGASPDGIDNDDGDDEEEYDEHIWTSPKNAVKCVEGITDALCSVDEENSDAYKSNSAGYQAQLNELDSEFSDMISNAPSDTIIIGDKFPFRYLAADYNLNYYAAFSGCSSESEPGVYTMAFLIDKLLEENIDTVFYLEFSTKKLAEKLCSAVGAQMLPLQSCHNVTPDDFENGVTYIDLMYQNLNSLREALY